MRQYESFAPARRAAVLAGLLCGLAVALAPPASAAGANLLSNAGFDANLSGWIGGGAWAPSDAGGDVRSGSALLQNDSINSSFILQQCVAVTAGASYVFGASAWIETGGPSGLTTAVSVQFYAGPSCTGAFLGLPGKTFTSTGHWLDAAGATIASTQAQSARFELLSNRGASDPGLTSRVHFDNAFFRPGACAADATTLCLNQGRFQVRATWTTANPGGQSGAGMAVPFADQSGSFWFFDPTNIEMDVKVLNACVPALGDRYWVFAAGLTNVQVDLTVIDTKSGKIRAYHNNQGTVFKPITDTAAFATCP